MAERERRLGRYRWLDGVERDGDALRCALVTLTGGTPQPRSQTAPGRTSRWLGGVVVAAVVAAVTVSPRLLAASHQEATAPPPPRPPQRPPVAAVAEALRSQPCALVTVEESNGRILVTGTVAGERPGEAVRDAVETNAAGWTYGLDLAVADARFCAPLSVVAPALDANRDVATPLALTVESAGEDGLALDAGDALLLEVAAPDRAIELRVDYFTVDGAVVHLLPNPSDGGSALAAGARRRLGNRAEGGRSWTIGAPFGTELLLAIATPERLFPRDRPEQEPAADYLSALRQALAARPADAPAPLATARFLRTGP